MALWGGRFSKKSDVYFKKFNSSLKVDFRLAKEDILGSIAWSKAILESNVINKEEQEKIEQSLMTLLKKIKTSPEVIKNSNSEDIHSWVESQLIEKLGDIGKKIHTGRSRNDQVTTDLKLWCKYKVNILMKNLIELKSTLILTAEKTFFTIMPGYTHLQHAQPITFAYWCLAYLEMFKRDECRLKDALSRLDLCPLGSGALCGTTWNINREKLSKYLGFSGVTENSLDSVSDRDYVIELLSVASISMIHLSRFSEDLIFFNSSESNFIDLPDSLTSGSSLMPQKKNPDILELIRGKSSNVCGYLVQMLMLLKSLPLSYNKDMQEDKEGLFNALDIWQNSLKMSTLVLKKIKIKNKICRSAAQQGFTNATELADYLVHKGISFRESHSIVGKIVQEAIKQEKKLEELNIDCLKKFSCSFEKDVYEILSLESCLNRRNSYGGVSFDQVKKSILKEKKLLNIN